MTLMELELKVGFSQLVAPMFMHPILKLAKL